MNAVEKEEGLGARLIRNPNLFIVFGVTLMAVMGVSSIMPALPSIVRAFGIETERAGLLVTCFTLPGVLLTPFLGVLADHAGRKAVLVPSLVLFGLAGAGCSLAGSFDSLLVVRTIQGAGAASLGALNATLIADMYEGRERLAALGLNAGVMSVGAALYPAMGGALAMLGWRAPFLLHLLALPLAALVAFRLRTAPRGGIALRDYLGAAAAAMRGRTIPGLLVLSLGTFIIFYGPFITYFPVALDKGFGASPMRIGLVMAAAALLTAAAASQLGRLSRRVGTRSMLKASFLFYGAALAIMPLLPLIWPSMWLYVLPAILLGLGQGLNVPSLVSLLGDTAPAEQRGAFMAVNGTMLRLGQTLGPLLAGLAYGCWDVQGVFFSGAGLALAMFVLAFFALSR